MLVTPQPLFLNPLRDIAQLHEVNFATDFDNLH